MNFPQQIAKDLRDVFTGGNWTGVCLKEHLMEVDWKQATTKIYSCNTIAALVFHIHYYIIAATEVLQSKPLNAHDKFSYDCPPVQSDSDWEISRNKAFEDAEKLALLIEQLQDNNLAETFSNEKYGTYFRNIIGIIEHTHYHLGQIVLIKKIIALKKDS